GGVALVELGFLALLVGDQEVDAVQRHPAVVADDAAATVGIRQAGYNARRARLADRRRVRVEHAIVVGLAVLGEDLADALVRLVPVRFQAGGDHAPAAEGDDRALERRVRLQADDNLTLLVDVARAVRKNARRHLRYVQNALLAFLREQRRQL